MYHFVDNQTQCYIIHLAVKPFLYTRFLPIFLVNLWLIFLKE